MLSEYYLSKSSNPKKKFMVKFLNQTTNKVNTIHFGQAGADDYTITNNDAQKVRYKIRHANDNIFDLSFPGAWSMHLLWNKKSIEESIKDMEKRFKINIITHTYL